MSGNAILDPNILLAIVEKNNDYNASFHQLWTTLVVRFTLSFLGFIAILKKKFECIYSVNKTNNLEHM